MIGSTTYLRNLILVTLLIVSVCAVLNVVVDPYGVFRLVSIPGLNQSKSEASRHGEIFKRRAAESLRPKAFVFGNSRAEVGFDPRHPAWPPEARPVMNMALPGASLLTSLRQFEEISRTGSPAIVVVGLDFFDFRVAPTAAPVVSQAPEHPTLRRLREAALSLSLDTTIDSITTIRAQRNPYSPSLTDLGFNPMHDYEAIAAKEGYYTLFAQRDQENARSMVRGPKQVFRANGEPAPEFGVVREMATMAAERGTRVRFVIYPYHAHILLMIERAGLWPAYEAWKRELTSTLASLPQSAHALFELWDFSAPSAFNTESIPVEGDPQTTMSWYWEAGHFKSALGGKILETILGKARSDEFGIRLDRDNVLLNLTRARAALNEYKVTHPQDLARIEHWIRIAERP